jgi:outer membrane immunogenic protein
MTKTYALLAAASLGAIAAPAAAQDADNTFTGFWGGVIGGYDTTSAGSEQDADVEGDDQSIEGVGYGVQLGYDFDLGGAVIGAEAEFSDSTAKVDFEDGDFEGFGLGQVDSGRDLYFGVRLGAKVGPNAMIYAKGGYTNAKYELSSSYNGTAFESDIDVDGYRLGAGAEYALSDNAFIKLEYRYSNYSEGEIDFEGADVPDTDRFDLDLDRHQVMAGVGFRF